MNTFVNVQARPAAADLHREPPILPRHTRIGSALVSVVIATALLGSVVIGLAAPTDEDLILAASGAVAGLGPVRSSV